MTKAKFFELAGKFIADHYNSHTKGKKIIDPEKSIELISFDIIGGNIKAVTAVNMSDLDDDNWEENFVYYTIEFIEDGQFFKMDVSKFVDSITIPYLDKKELKSINNMGTFKGSGNMVDFKYYGGLPDNLIDQENDDLSVQRAKLVAQRKWIINKGTAKDIIDELNEALNDLFDSLYCKEVKKDYNISNSNNKTSKKLEKEEKRENTPKEKIKYEKELDELFDFVKSTYGFLK